MSDFPCFREVSEETHMERCLSRGSRVLDRLSGYALPVNSQETLGGFAPLYARSLLWSGPDRADGCLARQSDSAASSNKVQPSLPSSFAFSTCVYADTSPASSGDAAEQRQQQQPSAASSFALLRREACYGDSATNCAKTRLSGDEEVPRLRMLSEEEALHFQTPPSASPLADKHPLEDGHPLEPKHVHGVRAAPSPSSSSSHLAAPGKAVPLWTCEYNDCVSDADAREGGAVRTEKSSKASVRVAARGACPVTCGLKDRTRKRNEVATGKGEGGRGRRNKKACKEGGATSNAAATTSNAAAATSNDAEAASSYADADGPDPEAKKPWLERKDKSLGALCQRICSVLRQTKKIGSVFTRNEVVDDLIFLYSPPFPPRAEKEEEKEKGHAKQEGNVLANERAALAPEIAAAPGESKSTRTVRRRVYDLLKMLTTLGVIERRPHVECEYIWHDTTRVQKTLARLQRTELSLSGETSAIFTSTGLCRPRTRSLMPVFHLGATVPSGHSKTTQRATYPDGEAFCADAFSEERKCASAFQIGESVSELSGSTGRRQQQQRQRRSHNNRRRRGGPMGAAEEVTLLNMATKVLQLFLQAPVGASLGLFDIVYAFIEPPVDRKSDAFRSAVRRLYDIANVFLSFGILNKKKSARKLGRGPLVFAWTGQGEFSLDVLATLSDEAVFAPFSPQTVLEHADSPRKLVPVKKK